jgi:hypothetical protein
MNSETVEGITTAASSILWQRDANTSVKFEFLPAAMTAGRCDPGGSEGCYLYTWSTSVGSMSGTYQIQGTVLSLYPYPTGATETYTLVGLEAKAASCAVDAVRIGCADDASTCALAGDYPKQS